MCLVNFFHERNNAEIFWAERQTPFRRRSNNMLLLVRSSCFLCSGRRRRGFTLEKTGTVILSSCISWYPAIFAQHVIFCIYDFKFWTNNAARNACHISLEEGWKIPYARMQYYYICGMVVSIFSKVQSSMRVHWVFTILSFQGKSLDCNKAYIAYHFRIYDMRIGLKRKINGFRSRFSLLFAPGTHRLFYVVQGCKREGNWRKRKAKSSSAIL